MSAQIIDTHCHASDVWYEPAEILLGQMDRSGVSRAVLTQLLGQFDNSYQRTCVERWPDRFISIGAIDTADPAWMSAIARLADEGHWGVRLRPISAPGQQAPVAEVWRRAADAGLAISCVASMEQLAESEFAELVAASGTAPILLEHGAGLGRHDRSDAEHVLDALLALGGTQRLFLKLPCLGQIEPRQIRLDGSSRPIEPSAAFDRLMKLVDSFGPARVMWGSDFPVVSSREGYGNALAWTREAFAARRAGDREFIFGETAAMLFRAS